MRKTVPVSFPLGPHVIFALLVLTVMMFPAAASADVLTPGSSGSPDTFAACSGCTLFAVLDTGPKTVGVVTVDLVTAVYSDPSNTFSAGDLDFMYQLTDSTSSMAFLTALSTSDFTGFATDVGFTFAGGAEPLSPFSNGSVAPASVDRSTASVTFSFFSSFSPSILPGQASFVLVIETNATKFVPGSALVFDNAGVEVPLNAFEPSGSPTPTPEPASLLLLGSGLLGLVGHRLRRST